LCSSTFNYLCSSLFTVHVFIADCGLRITDCGLRIANCSRVQTLVYPCLSRNTRSACPHEANFTDPASVRQTVAIGSNPYPNRDTPTTRPCPLSPSFPLHSPHLLDPPFTSGVLQFLNLQIAEECHFWQALAYRSNINNGRRDAPCALPIERRCDNGMLDSGIHTAT
jgi:hypothetical protein